MNAPEATTRKDREDIAISAAADALLAVCALQTGTDPVLAFRRAREALIDISRRAEAEQRDREAADRARG